MRNGLLFAVGSGTFIGPAMMAGWAVLCFRGSWVRVGKIREQGSKGTERQGTRERGSGKTGTKGPRDQGTKAPREPRWERFWSVRRSLARTSWDHCAPKGANDRQSWRKFLGRVFNGLGRSIAGGARWDGVFHRHVEWEEVGETREIPVTYGNSLPIKSG